MGYRFLHTGQVKRASFLHRLDPRAKLLLTVLLTTVVLAVNTLPVAAIQMLMFGCLCLAAGIPLKKIFPHSKLLLSIIVLVILMQLLFGSESGGYLLKPLFPEKIPLIGGYGSLRLNGLLTGLMVSCKVIAVSVLLPALVLTTETRHLAFAFTRLGFNYRFAYITTSALNLIPLFEQEARLMIEARKLRGMKSLEKRNLFARLNEYSKLAIPLIIKAIRRAGLVGLAMDSRAFGSHQKRTWLMESRFSMIDCAAFALGIAWSAIAVSANFFLAW